MNYWQLENREFLYPWVYTSWVNAISALGALPACPRRFILFSSSLYNAFSTTNDISLGWVVYHFIRISRVPFKSIVTFLELRPCLFCAWSRNATRHARDNRTTKSRELEFTSTNPGRQIQSEG